MEKNIAIEISMDATTVDTGVLLKRHDYHAYTFSVHVLDFDLDENCSAFVRFECGDEIVEEQPAEIDFNGVSLKVIFPIPDELINVPGKWFSEISFYNGDMSVRRTTGKFSFCVVPDIDASEKITAERENAAIQKILEIMQSSVSELKQYVSGCEINSLGELIISFSNGTVTNLGLVVGSNGKDGKDGINGTDGKDGQSPTLRIGNVASGTAANATITGTYPDYALNLTLQPGPAGPIGFKPFVISKMGVSSAGMVISFPEDKIQANADYIVIPVQTSDPSSGAGGDVRMAVTNKTTTGFTALCDKTSVVAGFDYVVIGS